MIVVDVQNGFVTGGNLAVPRGEEVVPVINRIAPAFANIVITQDWHPPGHASFATSHPGKAPYDMAELSYGPQVLWPEHCVQGTHDAALHAESGPAACTADHSQGVTTPASTAIRRFRKPIAARPPASTAISGNAASRACS